MLRKPTNRQTRIQVELSDRISLELFGVLYCRPKWIGEEHTHNFWELIFVTGDRYFFKYEGKQHLCIPNELYLIEPNKKHQFINDNSIDTNLVYLGFDFAFYPRRRLRQGIPLQLIHVPEKTVLSTHFREISTLPQESVEITFNLKRASLTRLILGIVDTLLVEDYLDEQQEDLRNVVLANKAKSFISENLHRNLSNKEIAAQLYMSPHYLGDTFKLVTGMTLQQYHNAKRMEKALELVKESKLSISDIAEKLGYNSVHYFSRRFKTYFSVPPSQFR